MLVLDEITIEKLFSKEFTSYLSVPKDNDSPEVILLNGSQFINDTDGCTEFCWLHNIQSNQIINFHIAKQLEEYRRSFLDKDKNINEEYNLIEVSGRKPKLFILEGGDGIGKSVLTKALAKNYNMNLITQPNSKNIVGFLRNIVKNDEMLNMFERQLLHTVSHIVDAFDILNPKYDTVMDRSYISTMVYGRVFGLSPDQLSILWNIHNKVYVHLCKNFEVKIIFLDSEQSFKIETDDIYERYNQRNKIRLAYKEYIGLNSSKTHFHENETWHNIKVVSPKEEMLNHFIKIFSIY